MATQIDPIITDATGQEMVTQLTGIKNNVGKNAAGISYAPGTSGVSSTDVQGAIDAVAGIEADMYKNTQTYAKGDYCIYNNTLYKCTTAINTAEEWTAGHWTATRISNEITSVNSSLTQLETSDNIYSATNYVNNIGGSVTLSENFTDYKFLKIRVGVGSFDSWNITEFIVANLHTTFSGYYVFTTNHTSVKSVRLSTASNNLKSIGVISSSEASLSIYSVTGIR